MAFNKSKALESALKSLNQGRVPDAIREYQQILRQDPKDQVTLMTLGDLFVRQSDMHQATEYFERLAQVYLSDGFNSKAIAIYKKIAKLAPNELDPLERLADLYVQQGVLSEARPLFLQIAEGHLKANRAPRAVEVLRRLLEVEPENLRVQMRLAELYNVIGQKGEAAKTYLTYAQRLLERGEFAEVQKLCDRALEVEPTNTAAVTMKAQALGLGGSPEKAVDLLRSLPDAEAGGETSKLMLDLILQGEDFAQAVKLSRRIFAKGHDFYQFPYRVVTALLQAGQANEAFALLQEIREAMIEGGAQDQFLEGLTIVTQTLPGEIGPLDALVSFCRATSNSFRLSDAISDLAQACADAGQFDRAEGLLQELIERKPDDEKLIARLRNLRSGAPRGAIADASSASGAPPATPDSQPEAQPMSSAMSPVQAFPDEPRSQFNVPAEAAATENEIPAIIEPPMDEETQRYIAQALTDVDLFSSYGLTQKAMNLLESVLQRAPRHTPALERLLDINLGAGDEKRTAELAAQLEQIHEARGDHVSAERFAELRKRFQAAAGVPVAPAPPLAAVAPTAPRVEEAAPAQPQEFAVTSVEAESAIAEPAAAVPAPAAAIHVPDAPQAPGEEIDLSAEWESLSEDTVEPAATSKVKSEAEEEFIILEDETPVSAEETQPEEAPVAEAPAAEETPVAEAEPEVPVHAAEVHIEPAPAAPAVEEFELELVPAEPEPAAPAAKSPMTSDEFFSDLGAELSGGEDFVPASEPHAPAEASQSAEALRSTAMPPPVPVHAISAPVAAAPGGTQAEAEPVMASTSAGTSASASGADAAAAGGADLNQLDEVFQEFRNELGEISDEDEDLETHYNLGIAYREMGLLDEAIGEFQKVAKAVQRGKPFRYAMQCATLLGLTFIDKGEPQIATVWYARALEIPGLDQETILALRYDLGIAQELAGEAKAALTTFRQVYAMNIDYRDVAEHIATLQRH